jgi:DNA-binding response OmpR family regulator
MQLQSAEIRAQKPLIFNLGARKTQMEETIFTQNAAVGIALENEPFSVQDRARERAPERVLNRPQDRIGSGKSSSDSNPARNRRILIVEHDASLAGFLSGELQEQGFAVEVVHDGEQALAALENNARYHLVILALNLPRIDGISLIDRVRPLHPRLPMLVLTVRNRIEDKVAAFQSGADDYLTKPFSLAELIARANALMRRNSGVIPASSRVGDLVLNREERRVERNGRRIDLTPREFAILDVMMRHAGRPVSRATLLDEVWNLGAEPATNIVDVYMKYVRDKVDLPGEPRLTHTIRGFGYELREA